MQKLNWRRIYLEQLLQDAGGRKWTWIGGYSFDRYAEHPVIPGWASFTWEETNPRLLAIAALTHPDNR